MATPSYFAAGANRQTAAADWAPDGTLVYGAGVNLAVWRPADEAGVGCLLSGHTDTVKAVQAIAASVSQETTYFVSGGDDRTLRLWAIARAHDRTTTTTTTGRCIQTVDAAHGAPVNCIAAERRRHSASASQATRRLFATGGADYAIKIWALDMPGRDTETETETETGPEPEPEPEPSIVLLQTITTTPKYFPLCLALVSLAGNGPSNTRSWLLAAAGTSNRIQVLAGTETPSSFSSSAAADVTFALEATLSGHEGWVRSLDFAWEHSADADSDLLLASASQDKYVRLWRVHRGASVPAPSASAAAAASLLGDDGLLPTTLSASSASSPSLALSPANKAHRLRVAAQDYSVTFEALLLGHEDWIYSAKWDFSLPGASNQPARLLTTSADNSLAVWEADARSGIWVTTARLGELSKEKGATTATGSVGGFWVGLWGVHHADHREVVVLCRTGSWRRWVWATSHDAPEGRWVQAVGVSGHVKPVTGIAWSRDGAYLLSTSSDQTTRLHAAWPGHASPSWHEMARPQIHGYDLNCIDALGPTQFVSGADEKLMRVFHEPKSVARLLADLGVTGARSRSDLDVLPDAANMPVLGLSNKAVDEAGEAPPPVETETSEALETSQTCTTCTTSTTADAATARPPFEDTLARSTLWPETEKLYGHGYEISCLAVSHDGSLVASACRASSLNHAVVRLFETHKWTEVRPPLAAHALTVTRLRFSDDDQFLLSVGRDRQWALFQRSGSSPHEYSVYETNSKAHARMILDCAWAPRVEIADGAASKNNNKRVFATAGRDKNVKVWATAAAAAAAAAADGQDKFALATTLPQDHPVTAVDFVWRTSAASAGAAPLFVLGIGTEVGRLSVVSLDAATLAVSSVRVLDAGLCLPKAVLQLAWRPQPAEAAEAEETAVVDKTTADLAVAGDDASLRIYSVEI